MCLREGSRDSRSLPILVEKIETLQCGVEQLIFFLNWSGKSKKLKQIELRLKQSKKIYATNNFLKCMSRKSKNRNLFEKSKHV